MQVSPESIPKTVFVMQANQYEFLHLLGLISDPNHKEGVYVTNIKPYYGIVTPSSRRGEEGTSYVLMSSNQKVTVAANKQPTCVLKKPTAVLSF